MHTLNPETLEALRTALEARRLPCPHRLGESCECEDGYPDPAFAPLLALVRERCPCGLGNLQDSFHPFQTHPIPCKPCWIVSFHQDECGCRDGFVTRTAYWQAAPAGALEGAFTKALHIITTRDAFVYVLLAKIQGLLGSLDDTRQATLEVVLESGPNLITGVGGKNFSV